MGFGITVMEPCQKCGLNLFFIAHRYGLIIPAKEREAAAAKPPPPRRKANVFGEDSDSDADEDTDWVKKTMKVSLWILVKVEPTFGVSKFLLISFPLAETKPRKYSAKAVSSSNKTSPCR